MKTTFIGLLSLIPASAALADSRTSANYTVTADTADFGGMRNTSASYTNDGGTGALASIAAAAPAATAKHGYIAQLYDVAGFEITAPSLTLSETTTLQLGASLVLDDSTLLALAPSGVTWSVLSGPLVSIDADGLVTAGVVFQDTDAVAQGDYLGYTSSLTLSVVNVTTDDFGLYAGDGVPDDWQVQHFGEENPFAAPDVDADGDGQNNLLEFRAGYAPTDSASLFVTEAIGFDGADFVLQLSRVQPGTRYVFERTIDFQTWTDVFTLDPVAVIEPFAQPLPTIGDNGVFRVRLEPAP